MDEIQKLGDEVKNWTIDDVFREVKELISKYIVHEPNILSLMVSNLIFSYFQDRFPTTHYLIFIGDNGTGKSTIGDIFEIMGYRGVKLTDTNAANISRLLGKIEPGQCILINDEAEKIDQSQELLSILKAGYHQGKNSQR